MSEKPGAGKGDGERRPTKLQEGISARMGKKGMTGSGQPQQGPTPPPKPPDAAKSASPKK